MLSGYCTARGPQLAVIFALLSASSLTACHQGNEPSTTAQAAAPHVQVVHPQRGTVHEQRELAGEIAPVENVSLSSQLAEPADDVRVVEGDHVAAGSIIAVFNTADLQANLEADEATAANARAMLVKQQADSRQAIGQGDDTVHASESTLEQAKTKLALDQRTLARDETLFTQSFLPAQTVDTQRTTVLGDEAAVSSAQSALQQARLIVSTNGRLTASASNASGIQAASIAASEASLRVAEAQANQVRAQLSRAILRAPLDAVIVNRNLNPGEYPNSRTLFVLQQTGVKFAVLNCSPAQIQGLHVGESAVIRPNGYESQSYRGSISAVLGQTTPGSTNFTVKVLLRDPNEQLLTGLPVTATVTLAAVSGVVLPRASFTDANESQIIVVRAGRSYHQNVHVIAENASMAVVSGVAVGTPVVAGGDETLSDGEEVITQ